MRSAASLGTGPRVLGTALAVTAAVALVARFAPLELQGTLIPLLFLGATWWLVLRRDTATIRECGLSLGGLFEPEPLRFERLVRDAARAAGWAALVAVVVFPPFALGWKLWWRPHGAFVPVLPPGLAGEVGTQLAGIALPEEAFYRGWLQSALDRVWPPRARLLGATVGWSLPVTSALFALGHFATEPRLDRLAVFFPSLLFGWLRARTGGVGAPLLAHALSNLLTWWLAMSFTR